MINYYIAHFQNSVRVTCHILMGSHKYQFVLIVVPNYVVSVFILAFKSKVHVLQKASLYKNLL